MRDLSVGKLRGIQQLANTRGLLTMCAADHRESLKKALNPQKPEEVSYDEIVEFKLDLCQAVAPYVSGMLLDPIYGAAQAIAAGVLPGNVGLLVSMEKTGYSGTSTRRITEMLPNWNVKKAKRMGASGAKILLYYRPDIKKVAEKQLKTLAKLAEECVQEDFPLLVEPVSYAVGESPSEFAAKKPELVIETARQITALAVDILKAEFPADLKYEKDEGKLLDFCQKLDGASKLPWVILSAGVSYPLFRKQVELACKAGASGFLAGRALWQEAPAMSSEAERSRFMETVTSERIRELAEVANAHGTPWYVRKECELKQEVTPIRGTWYAEY